MQRFTLSRFAFAWLFTLSCICVLAQERKPSPVQPPDGFKFDGTWDCAGTFRNGKTHHAAYQGKMILGETWIELSEQDIEPKTGYVAKYLIGYDAQQKKIVEFDANNFSAATYTSEAGWQNGKLALTSPISDDSKAPYAANRFVFHIDKPDAFTVDWEISKAANLNWVSADHLSCKRT